ncbi:alpha/beta hydrolase [Paenibacillus sp. FSL L8-0470]|uniref:alpha/beta hydrolase family protein n=1 Tax=unclassified Paenibacillus TaxID=185978 RepID=UPI0030F8B5FB
MLHKRRGNNYAAYCFDFCGGCTHGEGRSDGETTDMTVQTECEDLKAVMDYVKSLSYVDASKVSLMGFSQGGFISALTVAQRANEVEALILLYPALCIPDDVQDHVDNQLVKIRAAYTLKGTDY